MLRRNTAESNIPARKARNFSVKLESRSEQEKAVSDALKRLRAGELAQAGQIFKKPDIEELFPYYLDDLETVEQFREAGGDISKFGVDSILNKFLLDLLKQRNLVNSRNRVLINNLILDQRGLEDLNKEEETNAQSETEIDRLTKFLTFLPYLADIDHFREMERAKNPKETRMLMQKHSSKIRKLSVEIAAINAEARKLAEEFIRKFVDVGKPRTGETKIGTLMALRDRKTIARMRELAGFLKKIMEIGVDFDGIIDKNKENIQTALDRIEVFESQERRQEEAA